MTSEVKAKSIHLSDNVGSVIFGSGMVENVRVATETASKYISVQMLFLLSVFASGFVADI